MFAHEPSEFHDHFFQNDSIDCAHAKKTNAAYLKNAFECADDKEEMHCRL